MYTGLLHSHRAVVTIFLVHYVIKLILLFISKPKEDGKTKLEAYSAKTKVPEMIISTIFLVTGVWMWTQMPEKFDTFLLIKVGAVLLSIPLAVVGFKKSNKVLALLSIVLLLAAYGLAEMRGKMAAKNAVKEVVSTGVVLDTNAEGYNLEAHGKVVYNEKTNCTSCHGADGALQMGGAKNLQTSELSDTEIIEVISNGKNSMVAYKELLSEDEIKAAAAYVKTLRK